MASGGAASELYVRWSLVVLKTGVVINNCHQHGFAAFFHLRKSVKLY